MTAKVSGRAQSVCVLSKREMGSGSHVGSMSCDTSDPIRRERGHGRAAGGTIYKYVVSQAPQLAKPGYHVVQSQPSLIPKLQPADYSCTRCYSERVEGGVFDEVFSHHQDTPRFLPCCCDDWWWRCWLRRRVRSCGPGVWAPTPWASRSMSMSRRPPLVVGPAAGLAEWRAC